MRETEEDIRTKIYRESEECPKPCNRAYRRYFRDFTVIRSVGENGKVRIKHVYTGEYYYQDLNRRQKIFLRIGLILLWLTAVTVFVACASVKLEINRIWYVVLGQAGMLVSLGWYAFRMILYLTAPAKMTAGDWRSGPRGVKRSGFCAAICCFLAGVLTITATSLSASSEETGVLCGIGCMICGGMMILAYRLEANVTYVKTFDESACPQSDSSPGR